MFKLSALPALKEATTLRGLPLDVRSLSVREFSALDRQIPVEVPNLPPNHTPQDFEVESKHPIFKAKAEKTNTRRMALQVAACTGLEGPSGAWSDSMDQAAAVVLADSIIDTLTTDEMYGLARIIDGLPYRGFQEPGKIAGTDAQAGN